MKFVSRTKKHIDKTRALASSITGKAMAVGGLTLGAAGSAMATEPASAAATAFAELQAQAAEMAGYAWPVVGAIVGSLLAIGLFKKFANKAS